MKVKINSLPKSKQEIIVCLNEQDLLPYKETAVKELNEDLKINGYRLGKAPLSIAENNLSPMKLMEKMISLSIEKIYPQILKENKIQAIGAPNIYITKIIPCQEAEFKIEISIIPLVQLPDYKKIAQAIPKNNQDKISITDQEISQALTWLQNSRATLKNINRQAQPEDILTIDYQIKEKDKLIKNGEDKNYSFVLGKGNFIPGFEDNLIGLKPKEEKKFEITVPQNWPEKEIQNKKLNIKVVVKEIKIKELPELNDQFAQAIGHFKNLTELKANIKEGLLIEKQQKDLEKSRIEILEKIVAQTKVEIPELLVTNELNSMIEELKNQLNQIQLPFEKYLEQIQKKEEELKNDFKKVAEKKVMASLVLREIASLEKITVSEQEIQDKINELIKQIPEPNLKEKINQENLKEFALGIIRNEKVFQILESQQRKEE